MINNSFSVTNDVTLDSLEQIRAKGYDFIWDVASDGYEWQDRNRLYLRWTTYGDTSLRDKAVGEYLQKVRYRQDYILIATNRRLVNPEPNHIQPPWLVIKGDLDRSLSNAANFQSFLKDRKVPPWKDWKVSNMNQIRPLSDPALHRRFASLDTDNLEKEVLSFAKKKGFLGRTVTLMVMPPREHPALPIDSDKEGIVDGESLYTWREEIEKMGVLLAIWELIYRNEYGRLGQIIRWTPDFVEIRFKWRYKKRQYEISKWDGREKVSGSGHIHEAIATRQEWPDFFDEYARNYSVGPAWCWLASKINSHMHFIRPKLTGYHEPEVTYIPRTLLDALWLLFMLEVHGKFSFARCKYCGRWFKLQRSTKMYCSGNCRRLDFYHKKQKKQRQGGTK